MSSQMEQFFKVLLCLVMVALLIGVASNYLGDNYSSFNVESTVNGDLLKDYNDYNSGDGAGDTSKADEDNIGEAEGID